MIGVVASISIAAGPHGNEGPVVRVFDGDSVQVGDTVYNLAGIDAPELGQICTKDKKTEPCGLTSAYNLRKMLDLGKAGLNCRPEETKREPVASDKAERRTAERMAEQRDQARRHTPIATCVVGDQDVSRALIQSGQALALPDAPPDYLAAQKKAEQAGLGIWGSRFIKPWDWRNGERLSEELSEGQTACVIKAITRDHRRLYFGPLDEEYERIDPASADDGRTFCSDEEARAAGWRRPSA